jgi:hypothetical protein
LKQGQASSIAGGTSVMIDKRTGKICCAVEKLGTGFLFVMGDSEALSGPYTTCDFIKRLWEFDDAQII